MMRKPGRPRKLSDKKIAIIGSKPDTWEKVPTDEGWELWRFSRQNWQKPPKADKWFELHHPRNYPRYESSNPGYIEFIKDAAFTYDNFPFDALLDEFGPYFFTGGQMPWMLAYAITLKPNTIGIWGVDPVGDYKPQRSEVQHFVQIARDRGITVIAPEETILNPRPLYARDTDTLKDFIDKQGIDAEAMYGNPPPMPTEKEVIKALVSAAKPKTSVPVVDPDAPKVRPSYAIGWEKYP